MRLAALCLLLLALPAGAATVVAVPPRATCTVIFGPPDANHNRTITLVCDHAQSRLLCGNGEPMILTAPDKNGIQTLTFTCRKG